MTWTYYVRTCVLCMCMVRCLLRNIPVCSVRIAVAAATWFPPGRLQQLLAAVLSTFVQWLRGKLFCSSVTLFCHPFSDAWAHRTYRHAATAQQHVPLPGQHYVRVWVFNCWWTAHVFLARSSTLGGASAMPVPRPSHHDMLLYCAAFLPSFRTFAPHLTLHPRMLPLTPHLRLFFSHLLLSLYSPPTGHALDCIGGHCLSPSCYRCGRTRGC